MNCEIIRKLGLIVFAAATVSALPPSIGGDHGEFAHPPDGPTPPRARGPQNWEHGDSWEHHPAGPERRRHFQEEREEFEEDFLAPPLPDRRMRRLPRPPAPPPFFEDRFERRFRGRPEDEGERDVIIRRRFPAPEGEHDVLIRRKGFGPKPEMRRFPGPGRFQREMEEGGRDEGDSRITHVRQAIRHLRAAGLNEPAEHLTRQLEKMEQESHGGGEEVEKLKRHIQNLEMERSALQKKLEEERAGFEKKARRIKEEMLEMKAKISREKDGDDEDEKKK